MPDSSFSREKLYEMYDSAMSWQPGQPEQPMDMIPESTAMNQLLMEAKARAGVSQ
jgi:hypothetical protein